MFLHIPGRHTHVQLASLEHPGSGFFSNKPISKPTRLKLHPFPTVPPWKSSAAVLSCVKRCGSESRETDWTRLDVYSQGELTPPRCKNMDWPVLSAVVRPLYFIFWGCPVASATRVRLMQEDCSIMRGERGLFLWLNPKKQGPSLMGIGFCCVVVNCIWASSWNLQHSVESCQNRPVFILLHK